LEQCIITATKSKHITIHDVRTEKIVQHYDAHEGPVNSFAVHPDGGFMVSVSGNEIKVNFTINLRYGT